MRRLYFLVPTLDSATQIVDELLLARIEERHIHIAAKDHHALEEKNLPEANLLQESDFIPALERGLAVGGATGAVAGLAALAMGGFVLAGGAILWSAVLAMSLAGAGMGAWISSMIGVDVPNSQLKEFQQSIDAGQLLFMIDVPKVRVDEISEMVKKHHPEAEIEGTEPTVPAFP